MEWENIKPEKYTGGIVFNSIETIDKMVLHQVMLAIDESDLIIFMVDAQTGTTDIDKEIAKILYPHKDKVMLVANKADNEKYEWEVYDFLQLGFGDVIPISAAQGRNTGDFLDARNRTHSGNTIHFSTGRKVLCYADCCCRKTQCRQKFYCKSAFRQSKIDCN